jgi:hypothetical protein
MSSDILTRKETLTVNLSTKQIITILNGLIHAAAEPLFMHSSLMRQLLLQATMQTQVDHRRKISSHNKETTTALIVHAVMHRDYTAIKLCNMDRGMLFKAVDMVLGNLRQAMQLEQELLRYPRSRRRLLQMEKLSQTTGINSNLLTPLARWVITYYNAYRTFKEYIIEKYHRFARSEANKAIAVTGLHVDTNDLFKNYLMAVDKAIDKCNADQGTLTHYITQWMLSARSSPDFDHQTNISFSIPANVRKDRERSGQVLGNMSVAIDHKHHEIEDDAFSDKMRRIMAHDKTLLKALRQIRGHRVPFLLLDVPIILNSAEIANLKGQAKIPIVPIGNLSDQVRVLPHAAAQQH